MTPNQLINDIKTSIIRWYPFEPGVDVIYIGQRDAIFDFLEERFGERARFMDTEAVLRQHAHEQNKADYIISIVVPETLEEPGKLFSWAKAHLKPNGRLLLGMNNRMGIKYFCGDRDPYTGRNMDGIDDYFRAYMNPEDKFVGRTYDNAQLQELLANCGFEDNKFYSVFSDLENASFLFADGYMPNEDLQIRIFPTYNSPDTIYLEEERLYSKLLKNGLFHKMANAFFVECSLDGSHTDALQVTSSMDRGRSDAMITIIHENDTVTKEAPFPEGREKLTNLADNMEHLKSRGVPTVEGRLVNDIYTMPLIKAETGLVYLRRIALEDRELFYQRLDEFRAEIMKASETHEGVYEIPAPEDETEEQRQKRLKKNKEPWETEPFLLQKKAFVDMIPLNTFFIDGKFVFYDQEFTMEDYPVKAVLYRVIASVYNFSGKDRQNLPIEEAYARYDIDMKDSDRFSYLVNIGNFWLERLRKEDELRKYHESVRADYNIINANRQRMNFSADDYTRLFVDIFEYADSRKLILFGSGVFTKRFLALYGQDYEVYAIVDNNEKRWGQKMETGEEIVSPKIFDKLRHGEYKVIICIKNYLSVMNQLDAMGVTEYSIFDPAKAYPRKHHPLTKEAAEHFDNSTVGKEGGKKYHVGYIAGVFDLYHIGHLNMFRRAKEMCDYLIVGVVSNEGVKHIKRTDPFVPFDERIEMVRSCRYVDEVVEIPYMFNGTEDAWKMHHFDVQFSGTDYVNDPTFKKYKDFLESHGATLEFFPYTQSTSSTKLKDLIEKKLI